MPEILYSVRMALTAITTAKTLIQIKTGTAPIEIVKARVFQTTKTTSELQEIQLIQYTSAPTFGTVTSATPNPLNGLNVAALAVGGTTATGTNASAEASGGTAVIHDNTVWNILNGEWLYLPVPEERIRIRGGGYGFLLKLNTAPAASQSTGAVVTFIEYQ